MCMNTRPAGMHYNLCLNLSFSPSTVCQQLVNMLITTWYIPDKIETHHLELFNSQEDHK